MVNCCHQRPANTSKTQTDALGRDTPYGTIFGFLEAAQSGNYAIAAQYLQMSSARRQTEGEALAQKLQAVMDAAFAGNLKPSRDPEGTPQEGVSPDRQKLGTMSSGDVEAELELVRVSDPNAGKIWLIASDTLAKVPDLYDQVEARQVETRLPKWVVRHQLAGMPLWQWFALFLLIPIAAGARMGCVGDSANSYSMVGAQARPRGIGIEVSIRAGLVASRHSDPSDSCHLPGHSFTATSLLLAGYGGRCDHRYELDPVASRAMVPARSEKSRSRSRPRRYGFAHAARRTPGKSLHLFDGGISHLRSVGIQLEHRTRRSWALEPWR